MTPSEYELASRLALEASALASSERPGFLADHCPAPLQSFVEQLVWAHDNPDEEVLNTGPSQELEAGLSPGTRLGPYRILATIGSGGMGTVYKANDTRLDREVAIKVSSARFSKRFDREAQAVASLNHPNICTLHDIGPNYLVMELVAGKAVSGPLPVSEVIRLGSQIAAALDAAHRKGIIHRDLKPQNILVAKSTIKLLDFGLAKFGGPVRHTDSQTITKEHTLLGTLQYMSPEQLEGKEADARSDIFAFGLVLYEMLSGRRAFEAPSEARLMAAILHQEPPPINTGPLDRVVRRCLRKDPEERWQNARDVLIELQEAGNTTTEKRNWNRWPFFVAVAALLMAAVLTGYVWPKHNRPELPRLTVQLGQTSQASNHLALSPDGRVVAIAGAKGLEVRDLNSRTSRLLPGTANAHDPFWSPDSRSIGYMDISDSLMKKVDTVSGDVSNLCQAVMPPRGGTWGKSGIILFSTNGNIMRVSENGGTPTIAASYEPLKRQEGNVYPEFLPDGSHFLFLVPAPHSEDSLLYAASLDSPDQVALVHANSGPRYASGHLLFLRGTTLTAQPFDAAKLRVTGEAFPLAEGVEYFLPSWGASFSASNNGLLVYSEGGLGRTSLLWTDRNGRQLSTLEDSSLYFDVTLSPNGQQLAASRADPKTATLDVWLFDLARDSLRQLTYSKSHEIIPVWSPDSKRITYGTTGGIWETEVDGNRDQQLDAGHPALPGGWSPNGSALVYYDGSDRLSLLDGTSKKTSIYTEGRGRLVQPVFSPDGRWLAYTSKETGAWEVFVESVPTGQGRYQISTSGGAQPLWRQDGQELFYESPERALMATPVTTGNHFQAGKPRRLFPVHTAGIIDAHRHFAVSPDGQRFLLDAQPDRPPSPLILMQNWARPAQ